MAPTCSRVSSLASPLTSSISVRLDHSDADVITRGFLTKLACEEQTPSGC